MQPHVPQPVTREDEYHVLLIQQQAEIIDLLRRIAPPEETNRNVLTEPKRRSR